ncbi:AraC family transcriptional regulator [Paenibacillus eucommiae]|uniref:AraC-like DNA-binding protein n=1 Tax=Paenibacillus eucommiae TaxID=1355755 RepID=A0ABS4ISU6_9BACL|nr:AraC family transcriptional regulator [Paenibacillus eucommiae]MBP1990633.1 AraC-like DNA-binding protein [Paenibacillus eucommiae]
MTDTKITRRSNQPLPEDEAPFYIHHAIRTQSFNMDQNHAHETYEIYYMRAGERFYFIKDRSYHVVQGDLVLIPPLVLHKTTEASSPNHERVLINFQAGFVAPMQAQIGVDLFAAFEGFPVIRPHIKGNPALEAIFEKLLTEQHRKEPGADGYLKLLLAELLLWMHREVQKTSERDPGREHPTELHRNVSDIVKHINEHHREKLRLPSIAEHFHISPYYLCHIFKKVTGFTLVEYVQQIRIREAQKLLKNTRLSVSTIAEESGFDSSTHFGRVFKSLCGRSPLQYRKQMKSQ